MKGYIEVTNEYGGLELISVKHICHIYTETWHDDEDAAQTVISYAPGESVRCFESYSKVKELIILSEAI